MFLMTLPAEINVQSIQQSALGDSSTDSVPQSSNQRSTHIETLLLVFTLIGYLALLISLVYVAVSVSASRDARLDRSILNQESVRNIEIDT